MVVRKDWVAIRIGGCSAHSCCVGGAGGGDSWRPWWPMILSITCSNSTDCRSSVQYVEVNARVYSAVKVKCMCMRAASVIGQGLAEVSCTTLKACPVERYLASSYASHHLTCRICHTYYQYRLTVCLVHTADMDKTRHHHHHHHHIGLLNGLSKRNLYSGWDNKRK